MAPDIPTVVELGYPSLELQNWYGFFGPSGLSPEVAAAWERELRATLDSSDTTEQLSQLGLDVETSTGEECARRLAADMVRWQSMLDTFGLKATN
jgi:tripartite-type tricarboxylate transporter receptor subunit TctC